MLKVMKKTLARAILATAETTCWSTEAARLRVTFKLRLSKRISRTIARLRLSLNNPDVVNSSITCATHLKPRNKILSSGLFQILTLIYSANSNVRNERRLTLVSNPTFNPRKVIANARCPHRGRRQMSRTRLQSKSCRMKRGGITSAGRPAMKISERTFN
jgi:hypothetical protein